LHLQPGLIAKHCDVLELTAFYGTSCMPGDFDWASGEGRVTIAVGRVCKASWASVTVTQQKLHKGRHFQTLPFICRRIFTQVDSSSFYQAGQLRSIVHV
jgi:hypothetical protein